MFTVIPMYQVWAYLSRIQYIKYLVSLHTRMRTPSYQISLYCWLCLFNVLLPWLKRIPHAHLLICSFFPLFNSIIFLLLPKKKCKRYIYKSNGFYLSVLGFLETCGFQRRSLCCNCKSRIYESM